MLLSVTNNDEMLKFHLLHGGWQRKVIEFNIRGVPSYCHFYNAVLIVFHRV